ncbi:MAG: hypothetical protein HZB99_02430 [Candidatus Harrisonbacteria bacterium]|nr:hypothetical protein [Candidatus Harrisonbacteria bacterium]
MTTRSFNLERAGKKEKSEKQKLEAGILSPEEIGKFEFLVADSLHYPVSVKLEKQSNFDSFLASWSHSNIYGAGKLLEARRLWFEMKKSGAAFETFFEDKIKKIADQGSEASYYSLCEHIRIYKSLGYKNAPVTLGGLLNHKTVWAGADGSAQHVILEFFASQKDPAVTEAITRFIKNATSEEYKRKVFLDGDLGEAARALKSVLGDGAKEILETLANEDQTFSGWFEKRKAALFSEQSYYAPLKLVFDEFNEKAEAQRLKNLEEEYKKAVAAGEPKKSVEQSDWSWGQELEPEQIYHGDVIQGMPEKEEPTGFSESSFGLAARSREWERGKFLNFYGRFTSRAEQGAEVNRDTYLAGLLATVSAAGKEKQEDYLNFLSGIISKEFAETKLPEQISSEDGYRMAALAFARALSLANLENRPNDAVAEIGFLKEFLSVSAEKLADPKEIGFMIGLFRQLSELQGQISEKGIAEEPKLPESAKAFMLYHPSLEKSRQIPDFRQLLAEKIRWYLANDLSHNLTDLQLSRERENILPITGPSFARLQEIARQYQVNLNLYQTLEEEDVPLYWEAKEKLENFGADRLAIFGRDGRYFFTALKAGELGLKTKKIKYVVITSPMKERAREDIQEMKIIAEYLKQNGVTLEFTFVDSGFRGSVPEIAIKSLAEAGGVSLSREAIDEKIKLFSSAMMGRKELSRKRRGSSEQVHSIERFENRPKAIDKPRMLVLDEKGKLQPELKPRAVNEQLKAWTAEHSSFRNFAPRLNPEMRIKYDRENPIKGLHFIQELRGNYIGTHMIQVWEDVQKRKFLLKGGPEHTVRADFVGQRFLERVGIRVPKTELISLERKLKLKMEFLEGWREGGITLPEEHHNNPKIQAGLLVDALLGQYDRTPWNLLFSKDGGVAFIDNGASLFSRARGGHKGFDEHFTIKQLEEILANPQFAGKPVNEAYYSLIEIKNGQVTVKNKLLLENILKRFEEIDDAFIHSVIDEAGFLDGEGSIKALQERIGDLKNDLPDLSGADRIRTEAAINTYSKAIQAGGEAGYLKKALSQRRDDILAIFRKLTAG